MRNYRFSPKYICTFKEKYLRANRARFVTKELRKAIICKGKDLETSI